jgi:hypothetical protein
MAAGLVALEGAAAAATGVGFAVAAIVGHPSDRATTVALGVLLILYGAGVLLVARGVWRNRGWARTPALLVQFFGLVVAWYQRDTLVGVTVVLGLVSVGALLALAAVAREAPD